MLIFPDWLIFSSLSIPTRTECLLTILDGYMFRKYKIREDAFSLLQSSQNLGQVCIIGLIYVLLFKRITAGFWFAHHAMLM